MYVSARIRFLPRSPTFSITCRQSGPHGSVLGSSEKAHFGAYRPEAHGTLTAHLQNAKASERFVKSFRTSRPYARTASPFRGQTTQWKRYRSGARAERRSTHPRKWGHSRIMLSNPTANAATVPSITFL